MVTPVQADLAIPVGLDSVMAHPLPDVFRMKPFSTWTVLPHGKLMRLEENVLSVTGRMQMPPMGEVERRMTVVRLADGRLVIWSAISLAEPEMRELESFGRPAYLIVPGDLHRLDARAWKDRYPELVVIAPAAARAKVQEVVPVDATEVDFGDPRVRFTTVPGTGDREAALFVEGANGTTLVINDLIFDLVHRPGLSGWLFKAIGMTGDKPHIPPVVRMRKVVDKGALSAALQQWSRLPRLERVIISHGEIISRGKAGEVLSRVAREIAP
jgi:hypothetical protein